MERLCFTFEVYEGKEEEYKRRHDEIWPELEEAITESGFHNYSLFRRGTQVVGYAECHPDVATAAAKIGSYEVNTRWSEWFEEVIVNLTDGNGSLMLMTEVWHQD